MPASGFESFVVCLRHLAYDLQRLHEILIMAEEERKKERESIV
jgi:hypothetical protein